MQREDETVESPPKKVKLSSNFYDSDDDDDESSESNSIIELTTMLKKFMSYPIAETPQDLSQLQASEFLPLKKIFIDLNTKLPSSSSCERLFSVAKLSYNNLRGRMDDKKIDEVIFLAANKDQ